MYVQHENQKQRANDTHTHSQTQRQGEREREKRMGSTSMATSSNPQGLHQVFVYGSLLSDEVVRVLLKRVPQSCPAILDGFHIFSIKECVYPAIIPVENKKVTGKVLLGITLPELDILDTFEDVEYNRCTVEVSLMDGSQKLQAHTYVWANSSDPNLYGDWSFEEWRQAHIKDYIKMTMGFMEELEQPESKP
ncbi:AIG2-like protein D isoform X1 [Camellia sinensis]|uniref:AIG2-like protein D isoform X1 n=1 Tax=Camellia sinensis TaxID=4442 RepID=UPI0010360000|nr:AIG2-like protein D isoform X1 [Camellia sinensis]